MNYSVFVETKIDRNVLLLLGYFNLITYVQYSLVFIPSNFSLLLCRTDRQHFCLDGLPSLILSDSENQVDKRSHFLHYFHFKEKQGGSLMCVFT